MLSILQSTRTSLRALSAHSIKSSTSKSRQFASRPPRGKARRVQLASAKRVARKVKEDGTKQVENVADDGEQILSEKGMMYGFFISLGILPMIAFSVVVSTTPNLREQFNDLLASITGEKNSSDAINEDNNQENETPTKSL